MSSVCFYDNLEPTPVNGDPPIVEVERVYCFDFERFSGADWSRLHATLMSHPLRAV
jgi:hypothetical protein